MRVNGIEFRSDQPNVIQKVMEQFQWLPEPEVHRHRKVMDLDEEKSVICLQREIAYLDTLHADSHIDYVGTKNLMSCIFMYLYTKTDHFILHADSSSFPDLVSIISNLETNFEINKEIYVSLIGGTVSEVSRKTLENIITALLNIAEILKKPIIIESQKLFERNSITINGKYQYAYDYIFYKAKIIFQKWFEKPLPSENFKDCSPVSFQENNASPENIDLSLNIILSAHNLYNATSLSDQIKLSHFNEMKKKYLNEEKLIEQIKFLFSCEGFTALNSFFEKNKYYPHVDLMNCVFDIKKKEIFVIHEQFKTCNEHCRNLLLYDYEREGYFVCYQNKWSECNPPSELMEDYRSLLEDIENTTTVKRADISKAFGIPNNPRMIDYFVDDIKQITQQEIKPAFKFC